MTGVCVVVVIIIIMIRVVRTDPGHRIGPPRASVCCDVNERNNNSPPWVCVVVSFSPRLSSLDRAECFSETCTDMKPTLSKVENKVAQLSVKGATETK